MFEKEKKTSPSFWDFVKKFPALRYLKAPVFNVHQLYERYPNGLESGCFTFVINQFSFYGWNFDTKEWNKIGLSLEDIVISWEDIENKPNLLTIQDMVDAGFIKEAPEDGKSYVRKDGNWIEAFKGVEEAPVDGQKYARSMEEWTPCNCDGGQVVPPQPPELSMIVSPQNIIFNPESDQQAVTVIITGDQDNTFTVSEKPSWASIQNQTATGFNLVVTDNSTFEQDRSGTVTIVANANASVTETIQITQYGAFLSEFRFDAVIPPEKENQEVTLFNMGCKVAGGQARIWWGDGVVEDIESVPVSDVNTFSDPAGGGDINITVGHNYSHIYASADTYPVIVKTRNSVDSFRFALLDAGVNNEWYNTQNNVGKTNNFVTNIKKVQSDSIKNASRMFAGVKYGSFPPTFILECPNIGVDQGGHGVDYMFEFFGVRDYSLYAPSDPNTMSNPTQDDWDAWDNEHSDINYGGRENYSLLLPDNFFSQIANKTLITSANRIYNGSGFLQLKRNMLAFSTALTSVIETFRGTFLAGNNWTTRHSYDYRSIEDAQFMPLFIDSEIFWDNPNINNFAGCFWWVGDFYGRYDSGYNYQSIYKAEMFKGNQGQNINISYMFRQANRAVFEANLFRETDNNGISFGQRIQKMDGCFWGALNNGMPRIGGSYSLMPAMQTGRSFYGVALSEYSGSGMPTPNSLFPDSSYPNMLSMVAAFGWRGDGNPDNPMTPSGKRRIDTGFNSLPFVSASSDNPPVLTGGQVFGEPYSSWDNWIQNLIINQFSIEAFLSKFPGVTASSGTNPETKTVDGETDGAAYNFWDMDVVDFNGNMKASDYNSYHDRPSVKGEADMINWGWGVSV